VVLVPEATEAAAAIVPAVIIDTCARIWSAFHSPAGGMGLGAPESATVAAAFTVAAASSSAR